MVSSATNLPESFLKVGVGLAFMALQLRRIRESERGRRRWRNSGFYEVLKIMEMFVCCFMKS